MSERYSQKDEQDWVLRSVEGITNGRFLDIGAYDGINYSNTRALVERGWSGVMVEAGLHAFIKLLENYADNDKVTLVHGAVGVNGAELQQFWNCPTTFSTTEKGNFNKFIHEGFSRQYWVPTLTLQLVMAVCVSIDVLSIDTEGSSVDLFKAFLMGGYCKPRCICVEHDGRVEEVLEYAKMYGYRYVVGNEENCFLEAA